MRLSRMFSGHFYSGISILMVFISWRAQDTTRTIGNALPLWAYPVNGQGVPPPAPSVDEAPKHIAGSAATFSEQQITNLFSATDWFPSEHAPMPQIVATGRRPDVPACAYCHLPNGLSRPENESVAGLPESYFIQQMIDFRNGLRKSSESKMISVNFMVSIAKAATPDEVQSSAKYFASIKPKPWIRVVEADLVPKTDIGPVGMMTVRAGSETEPIGSRVIEVPENFEQTELHSTRSGFVAYVPTGSLAKGEALVRSGDRGKTIPCALCHGTNWKGTATVPSIAGRSPSSMARQIIDIQRGMRNGAGAAQMKAAVNKLTNEDIVAITGYLASQQP